MPGRAQGGAGRLLRRAAKGVGSWQGGHDSSTQQGVQKTTRKGQWGPFRGRRKLKRVKLPARLWGDATAHPRPPTSDFQTPLLLPCWQRPVQVRPREAGSHQSELVERYSDTHTVPPWRTVTLEFQRSFSLPQGLVLAANFSCTILRNKAGVRVVVSTSW